MKWNRFFALAAGFILAAGHSAALAAEPVCLASIEADTDGNGTQETAELWGNKLTGGSSYYGDLLLMIKDGSGKLITAYTPSLEGGYANILQKGHFTGKGEQIIVRSLSGAAQEMQVRIIDAALPNAVQEIYTGSDNLGAAVNAAFKPGFKTEFVFEDFKDGVRTEAVEYGVLPHEKDYYINCGLYDENGNLLKPYRKPESRMSGVTVIADPEGMDRLATLQTVSGTGSEDTLAKISAEWEYDGGWQLKDRELYTQIVQNGEFCRNLVFGNGMLYKQQAVMDGSSVTYPLMAVEGKQELQNTINGELEKVWQPYASALGKKSCELDYTVPFAGSDMMSLMFFGVMGEGSEEIFERLPLNISLSDGKVLDISDVLDVENPDLLPVLALLGAEDKVDFTKEVPNSWYYNGKNLVFCQKMKDGTGWNEAAIPASELEKFMLNKNLLKK